MLASPAWSADQPVLVGADPAQGSRLAVAPGQVRLVFNHRADDDTRMTVTGPPGVVTYGVPHLMGETVQQDLADGLPDGDYVVQYYAHFGIFGAISGTVSFAVGPAPSPTPTPVPGNGSRLSPYPVRNYPRPSPTASPVRSPSPAVAASSAVPDVPATSPARQTHLVPTAAGSGGGGWRLPMPVTIALVLTVTGFAVERWWGGLRDRATLRRGRAAASSAGSSSTS